MTQDIDFIRQLNASGQFEEAQDLARAAMRQHPVSSGFAYEYTFAAARRLLFDEAVEGALHILNSDNLTPDVIAVTNRLLCISLHALGAADLARPYIQKPRYHTSMFASDRCWTGRLLMEIGATEEALAVYNEVLEAFPGDTFALHCRGNARLSLGDSAGFIEAAEFSARDFWKHYYPNTSYLEKMWEGEDVSGRSFTVMQHGGFGDYFQFSRFIPALRAAGASEITAVANIRMEQLLLSAGFDRVLPISELERMKAETDYWCGTFGLERARLLGAPQGAARAYLTAPYSSKADVQLQKIETRAAGKPCVGIYWHSDADGGEGKSLSLVDVLPLLQDTSVHWVIFQRGYGLRRFELANLDSSYTIVDEDLTFDETGAVMTRLSGMVSICAWTLHLAAALGVRTWLLGGNVLSSRHENRERESVLYPGIVTINRQSKTGSWAEAVAKTRTEILSTV